MARLNVMKLLGAKNDLGKLKAEHPQIVTFGRDIWDGAIEEGSSFEIKITAPNGHTYATDFQLTQFDVDLIHTVIS